MSNDTQTASAGAPRTQPRGGGRSLKLPQWLLVMTPAAIAFAVLARLALDQIPGPVRFRFDLSPLALEPLAVQLHLAAALGAFFLGLWILWAPKGTGLHKPLGWTWVGLMATTAISSFFIRSVIMPGVGGMGPIHALSAWVVIALPMGIAAIRRKDVTAHRKSMYGMFLGGMGVAGLFTFLPGRLMWSLFFTT